MCSKDPQNSMFFVHMGKNKRGDAKNQVMLKTSSTRVHFLGYVSQIVKNNNNAYLTARVRCILCFTNRLCSNKRVFQCSFAGNKHDIELNSPLYSLVRTIQQNPMSSESTPWSLQSHHCEYVLSRCYMCQENYSDAGVSAACSFCPFSCATSPDCYKG